MKSDEAEGRLRALIAAAGVDPENLETADVARTWDAVRQAFAERPDDIDQSEDGDGLLAQYGVYAFTGPETYQVEIARQFSFLDEDGEWTHFAQLHCIFHFAATGELKEVGRGELWSWDAEDFFADALATPGFRIVEERGLVPLRLEIDYEEV
jgi:hypothetical protein